MSWSEVAQINKGIRNRAYTNAWVIENSTTWTAPSTQFYQVIAVGAGGSSTAGPSNIDYRGGGSGGVCVSALRITANTQATITTGSGGSSTFSVSASGTSVTMNAGGGGDATYDNAGTGGTAIGGTYNYPGNTGTPGCASVGCFLTGLSDIRHITRTLENGTTTVEFESYGILRHGIGGGGTKDETGSSSGYRDVRVQPTGGCVIIIPLGDYV